MIRGVLVPLLAAAALMPRAAFAQASAPIDISADVNTTALAVSNADNLTFGTVIAGTPTYVNPQTSATSAFFVIQGARRAEIAVTFTLPTELRAGGGPATMPITFGATAGCFRDRNQQASCTFYDPAVTLVDNIRNQPAPNNHFHIWLGGTVTPAAAQPGGVYSATITMTVVYTGN